MHYEYVIPCQHVGPRRSSPKEKLLPNIDDIRIVSSKIVLILVINSNSITYAIVVNIPIEKHRYIYSYITTYPSSGTRAFNALRTMLHTLREYIHVL
jgi:hypothetical protein